MGERMSSEGQPNTPVPPRRLLDWLKDYWQYITAIAVAVWIAGTWLADQRKETEVRLFEARKPFLDRQLVMYTELTSIGGKLSTLSSSTNDEWLSNERRFMEIYWGELPALADDNVVHAAIRVYNNIEQFDKDASQESRRFFANFFFRAEQSDSGLDREPVEKIG